jgi:hypothetical protein
MKAILKDIDLPILSKSTLTSPERGPGEEEKIITRSVDFFPTTSFPIVAFSALSGPSKTPSRNAFLGI